MLGAYLNEVALVAIFLGIVLLASKVGKIGERVGALFERDDEKDKTESDGPQSS